MLKDFQKSKNVQVYFVILKIITVQLFIYYSVEYIFIYNNKLNFTRYANMYNKNENGNSHFMILSK